MAKTVAKAKASTKRALSSHWMRDVLNPRTSSEGPVLQLEFSTPKGGIAPEDFGRLFASLWRIEDELAVRPPDSPRSGMFVTSVSYNSPLKVDIALVSLPEGAVEAIVTFFKELLFYRQTARMQDAKAAERVERVRTMKIDNAFKALRLARGLEDLSDATKNSVFELIEAGDELLDSPLQLEQVHARPLKTQPAPAKRGAARRKK